MINVGIIGGAGYAAGELIRILLYHPNVKISFIHSRSKAGKPVTVVHQDLEGETDLHFTDSVNAGSDLLFLCMGHGNSRPFLDSITLPETTKVIDLSSDFRLSPESNGEKGCRFVYGLPELNRDQIINSPTISNPGCFATAIQLALLPLAAHKQLQDNIHVHAITGSTGAGHSLKSTSHFSWRNNNVSIYNPFTHRHLDEIRRSLNQVDPHFDSEINFIPVRGNFTRGIFATLYTDCPLTLNEIEDYYESFYSDTPFTHLVNGNLHLKQVVNTNKCLVSVRKIENKLLVCSAIDNLVKGASGQAVQNMNLMFGFPETEGLHLKPSFF